MVEVLIKDATVVFSDGQQVADIAIEGGKIVAIAPTLSQPADQVIDAQGLFAFPGLIDPHVHFNEPGRADWEGLETGTRALAAGGVTTFFDMPLNSHPPVTTLERVLEKRALIQQKALVNGYLWGGLIPGNLDQLEAMHAHGVIGFKAFMSNSGIAEFPAVDDYTLYEGMKLSARLGSIVAVHAENDDLTSGLAQDARNHQQVGITDYLQSRPVIAEVEAIQRAIMFAKQLGCALYVVHTSSAAGVETIYNAQQAGVDVTCETCPHYLVLTDEDVMRLGAVAKCAPPIRSHAEQALMWEHLLAGRIQTIASDHSPSDPALKLSDDFFKIWGGISGCQSTLSLLLTFGYHQRGLSLSQIANVTSTNIANRFGLAHKGRLSVGADADIALVDVDTRYTLTADDLHYRHRVSPYVGMTLHGQVVQTLVNGQTIFVNGTFPNG